MTDPTGLSPFDGFSNDPALDFIKAIFPNAEKAPIPIHPDIVPATNDPCVLKYLQDHYPPGLIWMANNGNIQQYTQENPGEGAYIGAEKFVITKGPGAIGARIGGRIGSGLIAASTGLSGVAEVAGAILTPFGTTAMAIAREACTCKQK